MAGGCRRFLTRSTCSLRPNTSTGRGPAGKEGINAGVHQDSVLPVIESGQGKIVDGEGAVGDRVMLHPTPGQTVGHVAIELRSGEHGAVLDIMHQPLQVFRPDWNSAFCENPVRAGDSRRWLLEHAAETRSTAFTAHFENLGATKVSRAELSAFRIGEAYLCRGFNSRNEGLWKDSSWREADIVLIGVGSRRRSASQAIDLPSDGGGNLRSRNIP
jgi:glyoxylase-like metal-dependent hydrolase (beta-lactamase superfamily II)